MKKWKVAIVSALVLGIAVIATFVAIDLSFGSKFILSSKDVEYHTKEELVELYWQNQDLLNSVKDSILSNKAFLQVLINQKDGDAGILTDSHKDLFSEREWSDIISVFEKLHPYMLMMERKGRPLKFYINFAHQKLDSSSKATTLYWFPSETELEYHREHTLADRVEYTQIDGNWYIVEETFPW